MNFNRDARLNLWESLYKYYSKTFLIQLKTRVKKPILQLRKITKVRNFTTINTDSLINF